MAAGTLFCRSGIAATGVDAIIERAGVAKATLYKLFGSKERLVDAVLEREALLWRTWFFDRLANVDKPPREKLEAVFDILGEWFEHDQFTGCALINAVAESEKDDDRVRSMALRHKVLVDKTLRDIAVGAGADDPDALVAEIGLLIDGAIVVALISRKAEAAMRAKAVYRVIASNRLDEKRPLLAQPPG